MINNKMDAKSSKKVRIESVKNVKQQKQGGKNSKSQTTTHIKSKHRLSFEKEEREGFLNDFFEESKEFIGEEFS